MQETSACVCHRYYRALGVLKKNPVRLRGWQMEIAIDRGGEGTAGHEAGISVIVRRVQKRTSPCLHSSPKCLASHWICYGGRETA